MSDQPAPVEERTPDVSDELLDLGWRAELTRRVPGVSAEVIEEYCDFELHPSMRSEREELRLVLAAVLPEHARQVREQVATDMKRAAAGRRDYATRAPEHIATELEAEARIFDTAAKVAADPREVMWGLLPTSMWTDADRPAGHGEGR